MPHNVDRPNQHKPAVGALFLAPLHALGSYSVAASKVALHTVGKLSEHAYAAGIRFGMRDRDLALSVRRRDVAELTRLLAAGVDPLAPAASQDGWSPLHEMASRGDLPLLEAMLAHVAQHPEHAAAFAAAERGHYRTVLQVALDHGASSFAERLIDAGHGHLDSLDLDGRTALDRLAADGNLALLQKAQRRYGAGIFAPSTARPGLLPLHFHALAGQSPQRLAVIGFLQQHGLPLTGAHGPDRRTLLHGAVAADDKPATDYLLSQAGTDVNAMDASGMTALHLAAARGAHALAQALLDASANPNPLSIHDPSRTLVAATPLMLAAARGHFHTAAVLAEDPRTHLSIQSDSSGHNAIDYARKNGHPELAAMLEGALRLRVAGGMALDKHARITTLLKPAAPAAAQRLAKP